jgi:hypothetical protein
MIFLRSSGTRTAALMKRWLPALDLYIDGIVLAIFCDLD